MYTIINMCFKISRYLESYYRYDDILAVNNDLNVTLGILTVYEWLKDLYHLEKNDLKGDFL